MPQFVPEEKNKARFYPKKEVREVAVNLGYKRPCPECGELYPLELRQTADGTIRDQPKCARCRWKEVNKNQMEMDW